MRNKRITKAPSFRLECAKRTERRNPPATASALCHGRHPVRDAGPVEMAFPPRKRHPVGMRPCVALGINWYAYLTACAG
ncbi:MAG: hypothetical protein LBD52_05255 [Prevotellaceae bacterium]|nr:hypothetical protein [Prevotellaceae bacterium]